MASRCWAQSTGRSSKWRQFFSLQRQEHLLAPEHRAVKGGRHDKVIVITRQGQALIDDVIEPLMRGERRAFHALNETEQGQLLSLTGKLVSALRDALGPDDF